MIRRLLARLNDYLFTWHDPLDDSIRRRMRRALEAAKEAEARP